MQFLTILFSYKKLCFWEENISKNSFSRLYALSSNGFLGITLNELPYGGLRLFVAILQDDINTSNKVVKDKIIKSLMQFSYDDLSLKGQLISKEHFGVIKSTKKRTKFL